VTSYNEEQGVNKYAYAGDTGGDMASEDRTWESETISAREAFDRARSRVYERYEIARQFIDGPRSFAEHIWREGHKSDTNPSDSAPCAGE
jgi:hypothetical protein